MNRTLTSVLTAACTFTVCVASTLAADKPGEWQVEGKVWAEGTPEPAAWQINFTETTAPTPGRPSIWGLPFSGTAIQFDDLAVTAVK